jgi:hypothetical protein
MEMRMKLPVVAVLVSAVLVGCTQTVDEMSYTQKKQVEKQVADRCTAQGYGPNSPERGACIRQEASREIYGRQAAQARQQRARYAIAAGMSGMSQGYYNAAASKPRTYNCHSTGYSSWVGGSVSRVNTTCY